MNITKTSLNLYENGLIYGPDSNKFYRQATNE